MNVHSKLFRIKLLYQCILKHILNDDNNRSKIPPTPTQMRIIDYLIKNKDDAIYQKDLENVLHISRATVSDVLRTMEKSGFIKRVQSDNDSRTKKIIIQDVAIDNIKKAEKKLNELEKIVNNNISKEDLEVFDKVLNQMINNIDVNALQK